MGKKYIIEIEDGKEGIILCQKGIVTVGLRLENESELKPLGIQSAIPYTEPDLEQVRKEAYEQGRKDVETQFCSYDACKNRQEEYQRGLADAWEAARKICANWCISDDDLALIFGKGKTIDDIMREFTATEAIEKIRQYEQEKEEKQHTWIFSEVNEPSVNTTLTCSKCGYTITIEPGDTQALNFCPKCGDNKRGE